MVLFKLLVFNKFAYHPFKKVLKNLRAYFYQDSSRRARLKRLVESVGLDDKIPTNVHYHASCYRQNTRRIDEVIVKNPNQEEVYSAARRKFVEAMERSLFDEGEMRTLGSIKNEYISIRESFGIQADIRSTFVKDCLIEEFGNRIVIHKR